MRELNTSRRNVAGAANQILELFAQDSGSRSVIYFDGWRGFGASAVLRAVSDILKDGTTSSVPHLSKVIHIDCSTWKSKRAAQRSIAVELKLGHSVLEDFDKADEEDDFNGVQEGSRSVVDSVTYKIYRSLRDHQFALIFHNGSGEEIDVSIFGVPPRFGRLEGNLMLWTFRRRFQAKEPYSEIQNKVKNAHLFIYESIYEITREELFFPVLQREAAAISSNYPCMKKISTERIVYFCLYELFLHLSFPQNTGYDWLAHSSNYWTCDGIVQGDQACEISNALREEIKWDLHPTLLDYVSGRFKKEFYSENNSIQFLAFKDKPYGSGQTQYPWIFVISRSKNIQTQDMQAIDAEMSSFFFAPESPNNVPLVLADALFAHSTNLRVLHLSCCAFKFASPPFICCQNIRFLGLDRCENKGGRTSEGLDQRELEFLHGLWVLDLFYTDWHQILCKEPLDLMVNLWELNLEAVTCSYTTFARSQLPNLHKLRIANPFCALETSTCIEYLVIGKTKLQFLDFLGNKDMKIPTGSLSTVSVSNVAKSCPQEPHASFTDQKHKKTSVVTKISLEGCTQLENLFMRGLPNMVELDLSGTAIKILDFDTTVVETPSLKRVFLLGCEKLRAIKWNTSGSKIQPDLELLCVDTRAGIRCPRPSSDLNKLFQLQVHAIFADARLARSFWLPISSKNWVKDVYFNIRITSSPVYSGAVQLETTCKDNCDQANIYHLVITSKYSDVFSMVGDAPMHAFPEPPTTGMGRHIEIAQGSRSVESEMSDSPGFNLGHLIRRRAESVHIHDVSSNASMPKGDWEFYLKRCRVERCPQMATVFLQRSYDFVPLETLWAADLLMARCIWSKGVYRTTNSFRNLQHLHLRSCPRLQFVMPLRWYPFIIPNLETLQIIHCGDLKHVFVLEDEEPEEEVWEIEFHKLSTIHLHDLPMLQQICQVRMVAPALQTIRIKGCWGLRRLPAVTARGEGEKKPGVEMEKDVWDALEWDGLEASHDPSLFKAPIHSRYYKQKLPRGSILR